MKITFFHLTGGSQESGVNKKTLKQVSLLNQLNIDTELILVTTKISAFCSYKYVKTINLNWPEKPTIIQKIKGARYIAYLLKKEIMNLEKCDCLYLRYPFPILCYPKELMKKYRKCKVIFEHNTKEVEEFSLNGYFSQSFIQELVLGNFIRSQSDAIVGVTDEITQYQLKRCKNPNKPHITIGNGFDIHSVKRRSPPDKIANELHLLFVANVSRWHGIDRLIHGLATYKGPVNVTLHIAGEGAELENLKRMTEKSNLSDQVKFHGFVTGNDLDNLFNTCHIAVGSLGLHRIGMKEGSPLKIREYCARGIPWIIACDDPDFPDDYPYIHRIPPDESPVKIEDVIEFAKKVVTNPDHPQKMRAYAAEHLDWSVKMKKLKTFVESLVDDLPSTR